MSSAVDSPLSPTSPPTEAPKSFQPQHPDTQRTPHTPTSPPLMSVGTQDYAANISAQTSPPHTVSQPVPISSSPPSSAAMSTQTTQHAALATTNSFPTPASSVSGHFASANAMDEMEISAKNVVHRQNGGEMLIDQENGLNYIKGDTSSHRMTNHDRNSSEPGFKMDEDAMELDEKVTSPQGEDEASLASLQQNIGTGFHVCKTSYTVTGPNPSLDLVSLYGLGPVAASVARTDPVTGEKINRLRKSYEGKIKGLGLAGRNKPVKVEPGTPGSLRHLTMWPEEEWQNQNVYGKGIKTATPGSDFYQLQMKAMKLEPGRLPNNEFWEDALGHEKQPKGVNAEPSKKTVGTGISNCPTNPTNQTNGIAPTPGTPAGESSRPKRTGKKRSYNDSSFSGYGEGFPDDDVDLESGFNSEESGRTSGKKKRKKDHISGVSSNLNERSGSYGVGMFGVGAR